MRSPKYDYLWVIQYKYENNAWEDYSFYSKRTYKYCDVLNDLKEYRASGIGTYRIIERREKRNV